MRKQDWEDLAELDPYWAVRTRAAQQYGHEETDEFFESGDEEIRQVMQDADRLGLPAERTSALDFGCGLGRLTRPLARFFDECCGYDVSAGMIDQARTLHANVANCRFLVDEGQGLAVFPGQCFDLIYTRWVLQHLSGPEQIFAYIGEFVGILKTGGLLVFQLRTSMVLKRRLRLRSRLYGLLRNCGVSRELLYTVLRLNPMSATAVSEERVRHFLAEQGAFVLKVKHYADAGGTGAVFYVSK